MGASLPCACPCDHRKAAFTLPWTQDNQEVLLRQAGIVHDLRPAIKTALPMPMIKRFQLEREVGRRNLVPPHMYFPLLALVFSAVAGASARSDNPEAPVLSDAELAQTYCQACHLQPDPSLLDKQTWAEHTLPFMSTKLGLKPLDLDKLPGGKLIREAGIIPTEPWLTSNQWQRICHFYTNAASAEPLPQAKRA